MRDAPPQLAEILRLVQSLQAHVAELEARGGRDPVQALTDMLRGKPLFTQRTA